MANNKIYVVIGRTNPADYTVQTYSWSVACFTDKAKAEQHVAGCEAESERISKEHKAIYDEYSTALRSNRVVRINRPDGTYTIDYEKGKEFNDGLYKKYDAAIAYSTGSAVFDRNGSREHSPNNYSIEEVELIV